MAILELNIKALPIPCKKRKTISEGPETANAQKIVARVKMIFPIKNIFFRPTISASLPKGTRKIADDSRNDIMIQFMDTAFSENSFAIVGKAILTAEPMNGVKNDVTMVTTRMIFL
jgi:hypothetical protein